MVGEAGERLAKCERKLLEWIRRSSHQVGGFGSVTATVTVEYHEHRPAMIRLSQSMETEERFR